MKKLYVQLLNDKGTFYFQKLLPIYDYDWGNIKYGFLWNGAPEIVYTLTKKKEVIIEPNWRSFRFYKKEKHWLKRRMRPFL